VSLVGFDDIDVARYLDPPLTTIAQEKDAMGRWAVQRLHDLIEGRGGPNGDALPGVVRLPVRLAERGSTAIRRPSASPY
jgi:DNA-binding LacI/PurR family transcriptional regulator